MKIQPFIYYFRGLWNLFCDHPVQIIIVLGILLCMLWYCLPHRDKL